MKQVLRVLLCGVIFSFSGTAHANWFGRFWEDVKREATNAAHNTEKTVGKAWEDTKRETTRFAHDVDREVGLANLLIAADAIGDFVARHQNK